MTKFALVIAIASIAVSAHAENSAVGKLISVQGNVTVGSDGQVVKAVQGTPLAANSTVLVSSGAKATVVLNEGCVIPLVANQHLVLNPKLTCSQQYAAVNQFFTPYRVAQAPVGGGVVGGGVGGGVLGGLGGGLLIGGGIIVIGATVITNTDSTPASGS